MVFLLITSYFFTFPTLYLHLVKETNETVTHPAQPVKSAQTKAKQIDENIEIARSR